MRTGAIATVAFVMTVLACGESARAAGGTAKANGAKVAKAKAPARASGTNMPPGWTWPPNQTAKDEGAACLAHLTELGIEWQPGPATNKIVTPILVPSMSIGGVALVSKWRKGPFVMDCFLAQAFAEEGAPRLRALGVKEVRFGEIFDYRNVKRKRVLSRHALGLAIDVVEFVTDDDVVHRVEHGYREGDRVLHDIEDAMDASGVYRLLLTPGNDPRDHHDHFHFEARTPRERNLTPPRTPRVTLICRDGGDPEGRVIPGAGVTRFFL